MCTRCISFNDEFEDSATYHEESPFLVVDLPNIDAARAVGNSFK